MEGIEMNITGIGLAFRFKKGEPEKLNKTVKRLDKWSQHFSPFRRKGSSYNWKRMLLKYEPTIGLDGEGI